MVLKYSLTGEKQKQLVGAISKALNKPTKYLATGRTRGTSKAVDEDE